MTPQPLFAEGLRPSLAEYSAERWQGVYQNNGGALIVPNLGRTACFVEPSDTQDGHTRVNITAPILLGLRGNPGLFKNFALNATNWSFGTLSLYEEDGLTPEFDYAMLGGRHQLDSVELPSPDHLQQCTRRCAEAAGRFRRPIPH